MHLLIDASNILTGGGKTHLVELLTHIEPKEYGFDKVTVFGHHKVVELIPDSEWLCKISPSLLSYGYAGRLIWLVTGRSRPSDGIWFVPGAGRAPGRYVTMCQNLLPLDKEERRRYFFSLTWLRLVLLGWAHRKAFVKASGVIFLNQYCFRILSETDQDKINKKVFIPHGVSEIFTSARIEPSKTDTLKLIYVSTVDEYKHQWKIAQAVTELVQEGFPIYIDFIGAANPVSFKKLKPYLSDTIKYHEAVNYSELPGWYSRADAFIFGSTCETFGMVLLEAMACGLPVLCSNKSTMPETLKDNVLYFDPLDELSLKEVIVVFFKNQSLRKELRAKGINYAKQFTWIKTSHDTFNFIRDCSMTSL